MKRKDFIPISFCVSIQADQDMNVVLINKLGDLSKVKLRNILEMLDRGLDMLARMRVVGWGQSIACYFKFGAVMKSKHCARQM